MPRQKFFTLVAFAVAAAFYLAMLLPRASLTAGGSDSSGYMSEARMIAEGHRQIRMELTRILHSDPAFANVFAPLGFHPAIDDKSMMVPSYPPGLPVHSAVAGLLFGWSRAPFLVPAFCAIGALALLFLMARELGLSIPLAFAAAAILGASATFAGYAAQPVSDSVATAWTLAALYCGVRGRRDPRVVLLAGFAFSVAVAVRPTNVLIALPLAFALEWRPRRLALAMAGALPVALALMAWNDAEYGAPWRSGYGDLDVLFSLSNFRTHLPHYSYWLMKTLTPVVFPVGLLVAFDRQVARHDRALLVSWFGALFLLYCSYAPCETWWYTRFLLPGIPALILGALLLLRDSFGRWIASVGWRHAATALLIALVVAACIRETRVLHVYSLKDEDAIYPKVVTWAEVWLPKDAVVVAMQTSGAFLYYSGRDTARWDWIDNPEQFARLRQDADRAGKHWYAVTFAFETEELQRRLGGRWTPLSTLRDVTIWRLDG